jgi:hypothetical protein
VVEPAGRRLSGACRPLARGAETARRLAGTRGPTAGARRPPGGAANPAGTLTGVIPAELAGLVARDVMQRGRWSCPRPVADHPARSGTRRRPAILDEKVLAAAGMSLRHRELAGQDRRITPPDSEQGSAPASGSRIDEIGNAAGSAGGGIKAVASDGLRLGADGQNGEEKEPRPAFRLLQDDLLSHARARTRAERLAEHPDRKVA